MTLICSPIVGFCKGTPNGPVKQELEVLPITGAGDIDQLVLPIRDFLVQS